jgi:hypothetical protein
VTRVSTDPADPRGSVGQVGHAAGNGRAKDADPAVLVDGAVEAQPTVIEPSGPIERFMSRLIRRLAWSRLSKPKFAIAISALGLLLGMLVGALAPNAETLQIRLPLSNYLPKLFGLPAHDTAGLHNIIVAAMLYSGDILACLGLAGMLWAHSQGWRPDPRKLFLASAGIVAIMVCLTPIGSSDTASYAAYGRIAALGGDPYSSTALGMKALTVAAPGQHLHPPVTYISVVGYQWHQQPSVYGPVATWVQQFAAWLGGASVQHTIWALMIINGIVFLAVGLFLLKTSDDPVRATLFWTANPVLILELVGGGHFDTLVAAAAIGAIQVARKMPNIRGDLLVGLLIGVGIGIKVTMALVAIGLAWPLIMRREWTRLARITLVALAVTALELSYYGPDALRPMFAGSQWVTLPSPLWFVQLLGLHLLYPHHTAAQVAVAKTAMAPYLSLIWIIAMFVVAWLVYQRISSDQPREVVAPFALSYAWIVVSPWVFAWYTALPWVALTQVPRNRMTRWLAIVTVLLALWHSSGGWVPPGRV